MQVHVQAGSWRVLTINADIEVVAAPGGRRSSAAPTGWSGSPPRRRPSRRWPGRRWRLARERCAREAHGCPLPRRRRQTQSRPRGSRLGRGPERERQQDPCRRGGSTDLLLLYTHSRSKHRTKLRIKASFCVPEDVTRRDLRDVPLQDFHLRTNEHPSVHFTHSISDVLQHQPLKAPAGQEKKTTVSHFFSVGAGVLLGFL